MEIIELYNLDRVIIDCLWVYLKDNGLTDRDLNNIDTRELKQALINTVEQLPQIEVYMD